VTERDETTPPGGPGGEDVGSVGEEAAKLFGALSDWARSQSALDPSQMAATLGGLHEHVDEHLATGSADCRYCPVCQVISAVRATSPEVRAHLSTAATSLLHAAAGMLATSVPEDRDRGPVEHIDLTDDGADDGWED